MHNPLTSPTKQQTFTITTLTLLSEDKWRQLFKQQYTSASSKLRNAYNWNRKQLQHLSPLYSALKLLLKKLDHIPKTITTVTIPERIMINENVKKTRSSLWFSLAKGPTLKKMWAPLQRYTSIVSMESVSLRWLVGVARGTLKAGPDWKQSVQSAHGRPWSIGCHCIFKTFHRCFVNIYRIGFKSPARNGDLKSTSFV